MKWRSAILISLVVTLAVTAVFGMLLHGRIFALFLLVPLGFLFRSKPKPPQTPGGPKPIEPK
jgi:hypothetical protein